MTYVQLQDLAKSYGAKQLFSSACLTINEGEHIGVIGPNGAGKSTMFKILVGLEKPDEGLVVKAKSLRIGYLAQDDTSGFTGTVGGFLAQNSVLLEWELRKLGLQFDLKNSDFERPFVDLSGGYRMRVKLLNLLGQQPDLMLLDEPTNYLDLETLLLLERFLQSYPKTFLLISHDREFLRRTTDHIIEVEGGDINKFPGNIDDYFEQKELLRTQLEQRAKSQQAKRDTILEFVSRFGAKATKARQAQSRLKSLAKMEVIEVKALPVAATIRIPVPPGVERKNRLTLALRNGVLGYADKAVLQGVNLEVVSGDHVGVVGYNGAGKSTLLKSLAGALPLLGGELQIGYQVSLGYYAQHVGQDMHAEATVFEELSSAAANDILPQAILDLAGSLLFSGDAVHKKVMKLSGGERARVALGKILLRRVSCLLLDEPTNHLDFYTVEALTQALANYRGTVIVVSHDQGFIRRITNKILEVNNGRVSFYPGTYEDYVWSVQKGSLAERVCDDVSVYRARSDKECRHPTDLKTGAKVEREKRKQIEGRRRMVMKRLVEVDRDLANVSSAIKMLNDRAINEPENLSQIIKELELCHAQQERLEEEWLSLQEEQESDPVPLN